MSFNANPKKTSTPDAIDRFVSFVGGTTAVTKVVGTDLNATVTYTSTGVVTIAFHDNPGLFLGVIGSFAATTQAGVKGYTFVAGAYNAATFTIVINIFSSAFALIDLAALQWLSLEFKFKGSSSAIV